MSKVTAKDKEDCRVQKGPASTPSSTRLIGRGVDEASVGIQMVQEQGHRVARFTIDGATDTCAAQEAIAAAGSAKMRLVGPLRWGDAKWGSGLGTSHATTPSTVVCYFSRM